MLKGSSFASGTAPVSDQPDRIDFEKQCRCATLLRRFRIKNMRPSKTLLQDMRFVWMLAQQMPQIGRRVMRCCDRQ